MDILSNLQTNQKQLSKISNNLSPSEDTGELCTNLIQKIANNCSAAEKTEKLPKISQNSNSPCINLFLQMIFPIIINDPWV